METLHAHERERGEHSFRERWMALFLGRNIHLNQYAVEVMKVQQRPNSATHHRTMNDGTPNLSIKEIKIDYNFLGNKTVEQLK